MRAIVRTKTRCPLHTMRRHIYDMRDVKCLIALPIQGSYLQP